MKIFTKLYADLFDLTTDECINLFGNIKPIKTKSSKSCSIYPRKNCKIQLGQTHGGFTVIGFLGQNNWVCKCSHGRTKVIKGQYLRKIKSCGCIPKEIPRKNTSKHRVSETSEYQAPNGISACLYEKRKQYKGWKFRWID